MTRGEGRRPPPRWLGLEIAALCWETHSRLLNYSRNVNIIYPAETGVISGGVHRTLSDVAVVIKSTFKSKQTLNLKNNKTVKWFTTMRTMSSTISWRHLG